MRVFGIGLPRTGTTSLVAALDILGFRPAVHNPAGARTIGGCRAAADVTIACRYKALSVIYPDARFVLTTRDVRAWLDSSARQLERDSAGEMSADLDAPENWHRWFGREAYLALFGPRDFLREHWLAVYRTHDRQVRQHFRRAPGRLLAFDLCADRADAEKWRELCAFLGVAEPGAPFPWENRSVTG